MADTSEARQDRLHAAHGSSRPSFEELYRENYSRVYAYACYRLLDRDLAEDIVSETFLKAARSFDSYDPERTKFSTWVFAIMRNCIIDHWRRIRPVYDIDDAPETVFATEDSYEGLDDTAKITSQLLTVLDDAEREIVFLKYHDEKKNTEIADELGMNPSTVATKLSRALEKIRAEAERAGL